MTNHPVAFLSSTTISLRSSSPFIPTCSSHSRIHIAHSPRTSYACIDHQQLSESNLPLNLDEPHSYRLAYSAYTEYEPESAVGGGISGNVNDPPSDDGCGGRGDGDQDDDLESALRSTNRTLDDLPENARNLGPESLLSYVQATSSPLSAFLARVWPGWMRRCAADPEFPFKVLMELTVGLGLSSSGMIAARGKDILKELDFALCDIAVGAAVNFILVYLLTPAWAPAGAKLGPLARLPANVFIAGNYSIASRLGCLFYKSALFGVCGFFAAIAGSTASQGLIAVRKLAAPDATVDSKMPNLLNTAVAWAGFMALSANPRYQAVAGVERALFSLTPDAVAKVGSAALRTGNNVVGGAAWVWWARYVGLQPKQQVVDPVLSHAADAPKKDK